MGDTSKTDTGVSGVWCLVYSRTVRFTVYRETGLWRGLSSSRSDERVDEQTGGRRAPNDWGRKTPAKGLEMVAAGYLVWSRSEMLSRWV